jgi:hypothetical protein
MADDAMDMLLESRPERWRLRALDLSHCMTLDGTSFTGCLSNDVLDDGRCAIRRASDRRDAKPLIDDGVSEIMLNLFMSISESCPFSDSSIKVGIVRTVEVLVSRSASLFNDESR